MGHPHDDSDIVLTGAHRAYLAAFEHWLKTEWVWGNEYTDSPARGLRNATLWELFAGQNVIHQQRNR